MVQMSAILPDFSGLTISRGAFHLRMLEKLSAGAYGVVYLAKDLARAPHGATHYAVKCLLRHPDGSDFARQQQREIAHHRAVSDVPGVVTLHAVVEEEFYTFLVLDLCAGGDLFTAIMERGTYSNNDAAVKRTFLQLVDALAACHEAGVYHRDLKPENVLCSPGDEHVYLADFGLSTRSTRSSNFGCGSSFYMSPGTSSPTPNSPSQPHMLTSSPLPQNAWASTTRRPHTRRGPRTSGRSARSSATW